MIALYTNSSLSSRVVNTFIIFKNASSIGNDEYLRRTRYAGGLAQVNRHNISHDTFKSSYQLNRLKRLAIHTHTRRTLKYVRQNRNSRHGRWRTRKHVNVLATQYYSTDRMFDKTA